MKFEVLIGLGSNIGDTEGSLKHALSEIRTHLGPIKARSSLYYGKPLPVEGISAQPDFLNAVVEAETELPPEEVLKALLSIERDLGRDRTKEQRWGPRTIDLDLLDYDRRVVEIESLTLPHPRLPDRDFVLVPIREICPGYLHPISGEPVDQMISSLKDRGEQLTIIRSEPWHLEQ